MSDAAAFGVGLAIGLVIVVTVLVVKRDELARMARARRSRVPETDVDSSPGVGLSRGARMFLWFSAAVTTLAGVHLGDPFLLLAGVVLLVAVVVQALAARRMDRA